MLSKNTKKMITVFIVDILVSWNLIYWGIVKDVYLVDMIAYGVFSVFIIVSVIGSIALYYAMTEEPSKFVSRLEESKFEVTPTTHFIIPTLSLIAKASVIVIYGSPTFGIIYLVALGCLLITTMKASELYDYYLKLKKG